MHFFSKDDKFHIYFLSTVIFGLLIILGAIIYGSFFIEGFSFSAGQDQFSIRSIHISDSSGLESLSKQLSADCFVDKIGVTYEEINFEEILKSQGQYIDPDQKYLAYSFYVKNTGTETVSIDYAMRLTKASNWMAEYVRVLIIEDDTEYKLYQKPDHPDADNNLPQYNELPIAINFESETFIFRDEINEFKAGQVKSFRIIIWLEDLDPDISDNPQSGSFETQIYFSIRTLDQASTSQSHLLVSDKKEIWLPMEAMCTLNLSIHYDANGIV